MQASDAKLICELTRLIELKDDLERQVEDLKRVEREWGKILSELTRGEADTPYGMRKYIEKLQRDLRGC